MALLLAAVASATIAQQLEPCDVSSCTCAGRSLEFVRNTTWDAAAVDASSEYAYMFSICDPIPQADLPVGCRQNNSLGILDQHITALKYKPGEPLDCVELGSALNMTGEIDDPGGLPDPLLILRYSFAYGCTNTFSIAITDRQPGPNDDDLKVTESGPDSCYYELAWTHPLEPLPCPGGNLTACKSLCVDVPSEPAIHADCVRECDERCDAPVPPPYPPGPPPPPTPPTPAPPAPAPPCEDVESCICAETDLSSLQKHDYHTAADAEGYIYQFAICGTLTGEALPKGCANAKNPSVVRYKEQDEGDCEEIGSIACGLEHGEEMCSLTAEFAEDSSTGEATTLLLHYTYNTESLHNTFTIAMTDAKGVNPHASIEPGPVLSRNSHYYPGGTEVFVHTYNTTWACLSDLDTCGDHAHPYRPPVRIVQYSTVPTHAHRRTRRLAHTHRCTRQARACARSF